MMIYDLNFCVQGINAVPTLIFNGKYSLQGAQPLDILEASLKEVIAESRQAT